MSRHASPLLPNSALLILLAVLTAMRLAIGASQGLVFDEAYYRLWALNPSFGYYDHAPMVAWWIALGRAIFGDTPLGIRVLGPLSAAIGSLLLWRMAAILFSARIADRALLIFNAMIMIGIGSIIMTPDIPNVFFWGVTLWTLAEFRVSRNPFWWLATGLAGGLCLDSKYSGLFLGLGILLWLITDPVARPSFRSWQLWAGGALALILFAPVFMWNAAHDYVSFAKQLSRATTAESFEPRFLPNFVFGQWALMTPVIGSFAYLGFGQALMRFKPSRANGTMMLIATSLPFILYLIMHTTHDRVNANWPAPLMPAFALFAALTIEDDQTRWLSRIAIPSGFAIMALLSLEVAHPFLPIPPDRNPAMLTRGWDDFGEQVLAKEREVGAAYIVTTSYADTASLSYVAHGKTEVIELTERLRYGHLPQPDPGLTAQPALFINLVSDAEGTLAQIKPCYGTAEFVGTISRNFGETALDTYALYQLTDVRIGPPIYDRKADPRQCN
jgi:4-amino-4-deoxy-L-arabinose transferase-like glycosyltransferase